MMTESSDCQVLEFFQKIWRWSCYVVAGGLGLVLLVVGLDIPIEESRTLFFLFYIACWFLVLSCFSNVISMVLISIIGLRGKGLSLSAIFFGWFITIFLGFFGGFFAVLMVLGISGYGQ